jgi:AcrR family transcriptional regulator
MKNSIGEANRDVEQQCKRLPGRRERHRTETQERIIRSALRLFSERGIAATTIEDITNAADVGKGTFFNYFPSKEHIISRLCRLQMGRIREFVSEAIHSSQPLDKSLYELALIITEEFARCPTLVQSILVPSLSSESGRQQMSNDFVEDRKMLAQLIAARQLRGEVRDDYAAMELAFHFQRALFGTAVLWSLDPSEPLSESLKEMSDVLWWGMRSRRISDEC